jgi:hypothetical protein
MSALAFPPRKALPDGFLYQLHAAFGDHLALGEAMCSQHDQSETHFAPFLTDAVVFARSTEDVVTLMKFCVAADVPIIPFGAGASIEGDNRTRVTRLDIALRAMRSPRRRLTCSLLISCGLSRH